MRNLASIAMVHGDSEEAESLLKGWIRTSIEIGSPLEDWMVENGMAENLDAEWVFPAATSEEE